MTETKPLPGRPKLLTADRIKPIADAVEQGQTRRQVAQTARVSYASLMRWLAEGRKVRESGVDAGELPSHEWMCLRLLRTVEEAEVRRDVARAKEAAAAASERRGVGRPPLLTAGHVDRVVASLRAGDGKAVAAAAAGVSVRTLERWLARGARAHFGTPGTEYERLCADLYGRVNELDGQGLDVDQAPDGELETKALPAACTVEVLTMSEPEPRLLEVQDPDLAGPVLSYPVTLTDAEKGALEAAAAEAFRTNRTVPLSAQGVVIDISRPRGRVRSWLRAQLQRAADAL